MALCCATLSRSLLLIVLCLLDILACCYKSSSSNCNHSQYYLRSSHCSSPQRLSSGKNAVKCCYCIQDSCRHTGLPYQQNWQTDADVQEAKPALCAIPWTSRPSLLQQTLNISLQDDKVLRRSPANSLPAILRVGSNPGNGKFLGSDAVWLWSQGSSGEGKPSM